MAFGDDVKELEAKVLEKAKFLQLQLKANANIESQVVPATRTEHGSNGTHLSIPLSQFGSQGYAEVDVNELLYLVENEEE